MAPGKLCSRLNPRIPEPPNPCLRLGACGPTFCLPWIPAQPPSQQEPRGVRPGRAQALAPRASPDLNTEPGLAGSCPQGPGGSRRRPGPRQQRAGRRRAPLSSPPGSMHSPGRRCGDVGEPQRPLRNASPGAGGGPAPPVSVPVRTPGVGPPLSPQRSRLAWPDGLRGAKYPRSHRAGSPPRCRRGSATWRDRRGGRRPAPHAPQGAAQVVAETWPVSLRPGDGVALAAAVPFPFPNQFCVLNFLSRTTRLGCCFFSCLNPD